ncbi:DUF6875 domain-containing protein [Actinosynnema sp. CA-299493]
MPVPVPWGANPSDGVLGELDRWAREYLCQSHLQLGRSGPVCPYVPRALEAGTLWAAVIAHRVREVDDVVGVMGHYRDWFTARTDPSEIHHALLVVFTALDPHEVERAQRRAKTSFARAGLMIGEFHDGPPAAGGIRNPAFRPLRSPLPLLAVRRMVTTDLPFLTDAPEHLTAYHSRFPERETP